MCLNQTKPQINLVIIKMKKKKIIICQILEKNSLCKNIVKEKQQQLEKTKTELIKKRNYWPRLLLYRLMSF